jgi:hypothetical protein
MEETMCVAFSGQPLWFRLQEAYDVTITDEVLTGQAKVFGSLEAMNLSADFKHSKGQAGQVQEALWNLGSYTKHGEAAYASAEGLRLAQGNVCKVWLDGGFSKDETHNQDESGFFWRQLPTCSHWIREGIPRCCARYAFGLKFDWCLWVMYSSPRGMWARQKGGAKERQAALDCVFCLQCKRH